MILTTIFLRYQHPHGLTGIKLFTLQLLEEIKAYNYHPHDTLGTYPLMQCDRAHPFLKRPGITPPPPPRKRATPRQWSVSILFLPTAYVVRDGRLYFHFVSSHLGGGGGGCYPGRSRRGGGSTPARSRWGVGVRIPARSRGGGTLARSKWGVPQPGPDRGVAWPGRQGGSLARSRQGVPQVGVRPGRDGVPPNSQVRMGGVPHLG